jgi:hypothetical protein
MAGRTFRTTIGPATGSVQGSMTPLMSFENLQDASSLIGPQSKDWSNATVGGVQIKFATQYLP